LSPHVDDLGSKVQLEATVKGRAISDEGVLRKFADRVKAEIPEDGL